MEDEPPSRYKWINNYLEEIIKNISGPLKIILDENYKPDKLKIPNISEIALGFKKINLVDFMININNSQKELSKYGLNIRPIIQRYNR